MKEGLISILLLACACAQGQTPGEHQSLVNGKPVSSAELQGLLGQSTPELRKQLGADPEKLLEYYGFVQRMAELGEVSKLYDQSPYKEQIALARMMVLAAAQMQEYHAEITPDEERQYYEAHKDSFTVAKVKAIYLPAGDQAAAQAEAKAGEIWEQLKAGADFAALAKQHPTDMEPILKADAGTPAGVKSAVFALKPGEISRPLRQPNGFYILRLESLSVKPYSEVRGDINKALSDQRFQAWMAGVQKSVTIVR